MTRPLPPDPRLYDLAKDWAKTFRKRPLSQERANILCKQGRVQGAIQWPKTGPKTLRLWYVPKGTKDVRSGQGLSMIDQIKTIDGLPSHIRAGDWAKKFTDWPMTAYTAVRLCQEGRVSGAVLAPIKGSANARLWWVPKGAKDPRKPYWHPNVRKREG